jgi:hypothetical protein
MISLKLMKLLWTDHREPISWLKMSDPHSEFSPHAFDNTAIKDTATQPASDFISKDDPPAGF